MPFRPPLADHPRLGVLVSVAIWLLLFGVVLPWMTHEPPHWPFVIGASLFFAVFIYIAQTGPPRLLAYVLAGVSLFALGVYGAMMRTHGIPQDGQERLWLVFVLAIPFAGLVLAWRMFRQIRAK